jgi:prepilin-type N-terminal cleavage/methylation domain-containing protein
VDYNKKRSRISSPLFIFIKNKYKKMSHSFSSSLRKQKFLSYGFTLIELLVVIAIIGVLASIVLASLNNARVKARNARRITDIKQIQLALELYYDGQNSNYPPFVDTCDAASAFGLEALQTGGYIPALPRDPNRTGNPSCYRYTSLSTSPRTTYHLAALLEVEGSTNNPALSGDRDCRSLATGTTPVCSAGTYSTGTNGGAFDGADGAAAAIGGIASDGVYDVIP